MAWLLVLDLIRFFEFYLALIFVVGIVLRVRQYLAVLAIVRRLPGRWPRLLQLMATKHGIFLNGRTVWPTVLTLALCLLNTLACHLVWPQAHLTLGYLGQWWPLVPLVLTPALAMVGLDVYGLTQIGTINRAEAEKYLDQAEWWLRHWSGNVIRVVTFGYVNPHQIVSVEVEKALHELNKMLHTTLWWVIAQTGLRILCGLTLWLTCALTHGLGS
jgi:hypothetical protein